MDRRSVLDSSIEWLLQGPEWMRYAVRTQLLGEASLPEDVLRSKEIQSIIKVLHNPSMGFDALINGQVSYKQELYWYLFFLSDVGFTVADMGFEDEFERILGMEDTTRKFLLNPRMVILWSCLLENNKCLSNSLQDYSG
jgi:ABC-type uncharacterized transport system permease subunit